MNKATYAAVVLRYIHDQVTGEFVNIGLVLVCSEKGFVSGKVAERIQRVTQFFPEVRGRGLRSTLTVLSRRIKSQAKAAAHSLSNNSLSASEECNRALEFARGLIPDDDSAFQWSEPFTGITSAPGETFEKLYERLVTKYEGVADRHRRTDDAIWRIFYKGLESYGSVLTRLEEHTVSTKLEKVKFKRALKNGKWHLLEPVSFDLLTEESIKDKAKRILGQMTILKESNADFCLHFLVGEPSDPNMREAYNTAIQILEKVPVRSDIFPESDRQQFVNEIARIAALPH